MKCSTVGGLFGVAFAALGMGIAVPISGGPMVLTVPGVTPGIVMAITLGGLLGRLIGRKIQLAGQECAIGWGLLLAYSSLVLATIPAGVILGIFAGIPIGNYNAGPIESIIVPVIMVMFVVGIYSAIPAGVLGIVYGLLVKEIVSGAK